MTVVFGAIGVGIGFGLQAIVNNFVSGLILMFERPLKVGDRLQTATQAGRVTNIGIRASTIRTYEGADVVIPNGDLITKEVVNWTLADELRRVEVRVAVAYGTRPREVLEVLRKVATSHPATLDDPEPVAQMVAFGESSLNFRLRAWVPVADFLSALNDLHVGVEEAFRAAGIRIPYPRREVLLRSKPPDSLSPEPGDTP